MTRRSLTQPATRGTLARVEIDPDQVKALLAEGLSVSEVAERLGVVKKTLERHFAAATGEMPGAWRLRVHGPRENTSPAVCFRLPEYAELEAAARDAGVTPNEWARNAVLRALKARRRKS